MITAQEAYDMALIANDKCFLKIMNEIAHTIQTAAKKGQMNTRLSIPAKYQRLISSIIVYLQDDGYKIVKQRTNYENVSSIDIDWSQTENGEYIEKV